MPPIASRLACATTLIVAACTSRTTPAPSASGGGTVAAITTADLEHRLFIIAHDSMMGRETGSEGAFKTAAYIAAEFQRLGLKPAGDNGTYFQVVPFWRVAADASSRLSAGGAPLAFRRDFLPLAAVTMRDLDVESVFAGPVNDPERLITAEQARGKFVIVDLPPNVSLRSAALNARRWPGVAGIGYVALEAFAPEAVARLVEGRPVPDSSLNAVQAPIVLLSRSAARTILGGDPSSVTPGTAGKRIAGRVGFTSARVAFPARNVVAVLPGRDPALRGEYVAVTAHNDHVGFDHAPVDHDSVRAFNRVVRPMGADSPPREATPAEWARVRAILDSLRRLRPARADSIRNGADDDGSGTVSILEIAEAMAANPERPRRSVLFVSHTAEEAGLLGSAWFTDHATVPTDSIVAEIDQDMIGRGLPTDYPRGTTPADPTYLEVVGDQRLSKEFGRMLEAANARQPVPFNFDRTYAQPGHPLQYYCR
ncbi:MAG TPA: M28 family peptidase, partial [Gemmatimonadaceae bacterium]|nr:M28 family peptidase [Gemmatimonadaceae bacterium]